MKLTVKEEYKSQEELLSRITDLLSYRKNQIEYKKRSELMVDIVKKIEEEGNFPVANYAFDNGLLTIELRRLIESYDKHWVSEIEKNRNIQWHGEWQRADEIDKELRENHPESFFPVEVLCLNGEIKPFFVFTKVVRLKKYGRKRLVIVHENKDLTDIPGFLLTDALHWESKRVIETWSFRWSSEIFHEFAKQNA